MISRALLVRYLKVPILLLSKKKWKRENWLQGDSAPILQIAFLFNFWGKMDSKKIGLHQHSQLRKQEVDLPIHMFLSLFQVTVVSLCLQCSVGWLTGHHVSTNHHSIPCSAICFAEPWTCVLCVNAIQYYIVNIYPVTIRCLNVGGPVLHSNSWNT